MIPIAELPTDSNEAIEAGWHRVGEGISRVALKHPDYPGKLLKVAISEYDSESNQQECEIWEEISEGHLAWLFAPIFSRSEGFEAILVKHIEGSFLHLEYLYPSDDEEELEEGAWFDVPEFQFPPLHPLRPYQFASADADLHDQNVFDTGDGRFVIVDYAGFIEYSSTSFSGG